MAISLRTMLVYSAGSIGSGAFFAFNNFILPLALKGLGAPDLVLGLLSNTRSIEGVVIQPTVGALSDRIWTRFGRRRPFIAGGILLSALFFLVGSASTTSLVALAVSIPSGYALARLRLPWRTALMILFLLPQAFPSVAIYINVARVFYSIGLSGTITGVVLVHAAHGLVYSVWIAAAAFAAVDRDLELAARNIGASPLRTFFTVTLPLAAPGIMASAIFVFLESLDEFTGTFFVGVPQVTTLPLLLYNASMGGNYQIASITALILLVPSVVFMIVIERFLKADVLSKVGQ